MRTMRLRAAPVIGALAAITVLAASAAAQDNAPAYDAYPTYPATLDFGTGLINIPVAWVSPRSSDLWLNTSAKEIPSAANPSQMNTMSRWNTNIAFDSHWLGLFSVGFSAYSQNPDWGFFGQALLHRQGVASYLPSLAVGVRNVGPYNHEDRFLIGEDISLGPDSTYRRSVAQQFQKFHTAGTLYGVATEEIPLNAGSSSLGLTVGYGDGLFSQDGGLGSYYNRRGTIAKGLFLGARFAAHPTANTMLTVMGENDGFDYNAGVALDWRGITFGVYGTELEEGGGRSAAGGYIYNYTKMNVSLGYRGNAVDIGRGILLRTRISALTREQEQLRYEIAVRNRRIAGLQVALHEAQAGELATIQQRRSELQRQIDEERDAVQRAQQRLDDLARRQGQTPPATTPPSATPPSTTPPSSSTPPATTPPASTPPSGSTTTPPSI